LRLFAANVMKGLLILPLEWPWLRAFRKPSAPAPPQSLYFLLGGIFGLLPDTLDFKFYRFFIKHDIEVAPDPLKPMRR